MKGKIAEGCFWVVMAVAGLVYSNSFDQDLNNYALGTVSWPRALLAILLVFGLSQIVLALARQGAVHEREESSPLTLRTLLRIVFILVTPLVLVWLLPRIGFVPFALVFVFVLVLGFGYSHKAKAAVISLLSTAVIMSVFTNLLFLPLPLGTWPGFYEFNSTITWLLGG